VKFTIDGSWQRFGRVVLAGSPLKFFRTTARGAEIVSAIESGEDVAPSDLVDRLLDAGAVHPSIELTTSSFTVEDVTVVTPQLGGSVHQDNRITVDDGSQPPIRGATIRLPVNQGPAAARNAARALVNTPLIAFVDVDVTTTGPQWLGPLLAHFEDENVALAAPRVQGERDSPLDLAQEPARIRAGTRVSYVPGAAIVVRTEAFDAIGGFDEGLRFGEDVDFVWRLEQAGWRCRYEPSATVWHSPRVTLTGRLQQHAAYGTSAAPLALRHPGALTPTRINGWTAIVWALVGLGQPVLAVTAAAGSSVALIPKLPDVPVSVALKLALLGHLHAGRQLAITIRRVWWPIVVAGSLVSKRMRWIALAAVLGNVRAVPTDVAYGWGVWKGMRRHGTWAPIIPALSSWPERPLRSRP
jgi:mycofactocin system glycosyltransferase